MQYENHTTEESVKLLIVFNYGSITSSRRIGRHFFLNISTQLGLAWARGNKCCAVNVLRFIWNRNGNKLSSFNMQAMRSLHFCVHYKREPASYSCTECDTKLLIHGIKPHLTSLNICRYTAPPCHIESWPKNSVALKLYSNGGGVDRG